MPDTWNSTVNTVLNLTEGTIEDEYLLSTMYGKHLCVMSCLTVVAW